MLDIIPMQQCCSNVFWEKEVKGSKDNIYTVSFEKQYGGDYEYDYECTCPAFKHRPGYCKHILEVKDDRCGWHEQHCAGTAQDSKCPNCGGPVEVVMCGV